MQPGQDAFPQFFNEMKKRKMKMRLFFHQFNAEFAQFTMVQFIFRNTTQVAGKRESGPGDQLVSMLNSGQLPVSLLKSGCNK